jgi:uncharacterized protein (TIGR02246 family)
MRILLAMLSCVAMLATGSAASADDSSEEAAVRNVFSAFRQAWDQPGMPGFETLFTEDADFVVITGKWLKGRDEIVSYHRELLRTTYAGSHSIPYSVTARFLTSEIAVAHVASGARYMRDGKEQMRTGLSTATLVKRNGKWLITAFHNTLTSGPGALLPTPPPARSQ